MRQVQKHLVNYSADLFGICSALYELGGLIVMHDASGCNSTYATHDEPRWYDIDSMIYISALEEYNMVLGNDDKFIEDVCECAEEKHPKFIAIFGSPIALMCGTDFKGLARLIENRTGIPTLAFDTSGMYTYQNGARQAFRGIAERFCPAPEDLPIKLPSERISVNLLGVTPLDFSVVGNVEALQDFCAEHDFDIQSCWAMGNSLEQLQTAGSADVNLVVSSIGLDTAKYLQERYGTPYVVGLPLGQSASLDLADAVHLADETHTSIHMSKDVPPDHEEADSRSVLLIGEPVFTDALRYCLEQDLHMTNVTVLCPLEDGIGLLRDGDLLSDEENDAERLANAADIVIADPLYRNILEKDSGVHFVPFPHEGFSGRMFRGDIPVFLTDSFEQYLAEQLN